MVNQGRVIATLSRWEQPVHDAETIEAIATVHALSFTKMIDIDEVVLKDDSLLNYNESIAIERTYWDVLWYYVKYRAMKLKWKKSGSKGYMVKPNGLRPWKKILNN